MKNAKAPFSIRLIYWLSSFSVGIMALLLLLMLFLGGLHLFDVDTGKTFFTIDFPVDVLGAMGNLTLDGGQYDVMFHSGNGRIAIENPPKKVVKIIYSSLILVSIIGFYLTWTFRNFIKNIRIGKAFELYNIHLLKHLSYGLLAVWVFSLIYDRILYHYIAKNIVFEQLKFRDDFDKHPMILVTALFIWVLSHAFVQGSKMKEELDLTI